MIPLSSRTTLVFVWVAVVISPALTQCLLNQTDHEYEVDSAQVPAYPVFSNAGTLEPIYDFARLFLQAVQPYGLPLEVAWRVLQDEAPTSEVMPFEAGYVVCLILAILYMLIIPAVGAVLAWRYFHSKKLRVERESPSQLQWNQWNIMVIACLSAVVILLLSGVILTFTISNRMRQNMRPNLINLRENIEVMEKALSYVPQKVDFIVEQFSDFEEQIMEEASKTGELIGEEIISSLEPQTYMVLENLNIIVQDAVEAKQYLQEVQETRVNMQDTYSYLQRELQQMQNRLHEFNSTLNISGLDTEANYSMLPSVDAELQQLSFVSELEVLEPQVMMFIHSFPAICNKLIEPQTAGLLAYFNETEVMFRNYSKKLPSLKSLADAVSNARVNFDRSKAAIDYYDYVRWSVSVTFCSMILIITLLMLAGLVIGASIVISPTLYSCYLRSQLRWTAVYLFYIASGMIFILSWLFIILVFISLFFGGNAHALVCRSFTTGDIFEFLDEQHLLSSLNAHDPEDSHVAHVAVDDTTWLPPNPGYDDSEISEHSWKAIKTFEIYLGCDRGTSLFYTLHMDDIFDMDGFLNTSMYLMGFSKNMQALTINLDDVLLFMNTSKATVQKFRDSSKLDQIDYNNFQTLLSRPIMKTDLYALAAELEAAAMMVNGTIRENLTSEAVKARQLARRVHLQDFFRRNMSSSIEALANISQNYKMDANATLLSADEICTSLRLQVPQIVQNVSECLTETASELLRGYFAVVRDAILEEALGCPWLPVSISNIYIAACENLIGPWNAFWLCLGWCCVFLIPGVIFSILAARSWRPPSSAKDKEPFHMMDEIPENGTPNTYVSWDDMKGKSVKKSASKTKEDTYESMNGMDFKKDGVMKKTSFDVYMTMN